MEEALRASEERYRSLFAGMTEGFALHEIVCDEHGQPCDYRFLEINPAFERLTGLKQQDVIGNLHNQLLPDDDPNWVKIYGKVALTGQPVHFENYSPALKAHYEVFAYCPAPHQFAVLFMNITDRKQAEEKIRQSERLYRAIGETLDYGVWVCAPDGRNVYASESFLKLVGMTQQQCSDFGWGDVLHPDDAERTMAAWKECVRTGGTWDIEHSYRGVDGQWHPILARGVPIRDEQGQITSWAGINLDISKQKQAEQALQEAHDKLEQRVQERTEELQSSNEELNVEIEEHKLAEETIFRNAARSENLAEVSRRLAAAGLSLQKVNDILSQSIAELIGDTCIVRLLSEDGLELDLASVYPSEPAKREHLSTILRDLPIKAGEGISGKVIKTGCSFLLPTTAPHQLTGLIEPQEQAVVDELQIYSLMCVPLRQEENIIGTIAAMAGLERAPYTQEDLSFLEDVANRAGLSIAKARLYRELECALEREQNTRAQLIQSEKYAALARMVASVAHEINNPVQTIKNCMYLLSTSIDRNSQGYEILDMAASEANRIGNLVSRLRDLYRPSRESVRKTVSMMDVLNNVSALLEPHLVQNKVKMEIETCTDRYCVNANADQIKQVFLNISLNAIDAMEPAGGSLSVKVSCPSDSQVCISFKDTGKGMSAEEMQHIFEPLYTTKDKGTGLGLAISYEIVSNHSGHITVESQPGQGATFSVWLPIVNTDLAGG